MSVSCSDLKEPVFEKIEGLKVHSLKGGKINIRADAVFFNPNKKRLKLRGSHIEIYMKNTKAAVIELRNEIWIGANEEFRVPLKASLPLVNGESGLLKDAFSILNGKKEELRFKGYLNLTVKGLRYKVPIDQTETINIKLF